MRRLYIQRIICKFEENHTSSKEIVCPTAVLGSKMSTKPLNLNKGVTSRKPKHLIIYKTTVGFLKVSFQRNQICSVSSTLKLVGFSDSGGEVKYSVQYC